MDSSPSKKSRKQKDLVITEKGAPSNVAEILSGNGGAVRLWADYPYRDLAWLEPYMDLVRSITINAVSVVDVSLLSKASGLREIGSASSKVRGIPAGHVWPELRAYFGYYYPALDAQLASGTLRALGLNGATDQGLAAIHADLEGLNIYHPRAEGGQGWTGAHLLPGSVTHVWSPRHPLSLADFTGLGGAPRMDFDGAKALIGLDRATRDVPAHWIGISNVKELVCERSIWDINAKRIAVEAERGIPAWLEREWHRRPKGWNERWVLGDLLEKRLSRI
ncbi:hypothetical protein GCM10023081_40240 [Arthrobacter ginkgonis]|uniref:Uncharacterized protein n=1 Tax=Arthrobacter ginkgonis TaxID=1630594 RepID=A0ABP7D1A7_9MICC